MSCRPSVLTVCLETAVGGRCMAHVMDLTGCIVRAETRTEALAGLPLAVREYLTWLARHGERVGPDRVPEFSVAAEMVGVGPFDPGDAAALFPQDLEPLTEPDHKRFFDLMAYSRADLLAAVSRLPEDLLDRVPEPGGFSIRRILRHVGNAEEWYVSRIVPPDELPEAWQNDESLPIFEFLDMERRTALDCLLGLDERQRSAVFHQTAWTNHPEEGWTARKVLRRFVEHEREHTAQIGSILARLV